jgi:hypothetical protein
LDWQVSISLHCGLGLLPYSHSIPTTGQGVPPLGTFGGGGHDGFEPPLLEPLPPELLPEPPPDPVDPLDPLDPLAPELLLEPPLELELPPEPPELELLLPSAPPSEGPVNVVPPHAHMAAAPATIQSLVRMSGPPGPSPTQVRYHRQSKPFQDDCSAPLCRAPDTHVMVVTGAGLLPVHLIP